MKTAAKILTIGFVLVFCACGYVGTNKKSITTDDDSLQNAKLKKSLISKEKKKASEEKDRVDSLRLNLALEDAFKISKDVFQNNDFIKEYEFHPDDSSYTINIEIIIGHLFSDNQKHFLLHRHTPWVSYINLYQVEKNELREVLYREQGEMTYIGDTIRDVNGDGFKDFLVHWYPSSGCCRRDVYNVYLNQSNKGMFTKDYKFINPTFSPEEKIIRGVEYGHPGEVGLYKYRWNGLQIDTLEFIYPNVNHEGLFIKTKREKYRPSEKDGIVLKNVPKEYRYIESYEWFADF